MIEIIKHGNRPKTDKRARFKCGRCGCEWIATVADYTSHIGGMGHKWVSCRCPECDYVDSRDISGREDCRDNVGMNNDTGGEIGEQDTGVSRPDGNCLDCKFQYLDNSDYWCSICPGNPEDI